MADYSDLTVQITLTIAEMRNLVALVNLAAEQLPEDQLPEIANDVSGMYFELMASLYQDGHLGDFEPE